MLSPRATRVTILTATGALLVIAAWEFAFLWPYIGAQQAIGTDHAFYVSIARRWPDTGQLYLPHQLAGPYVVQTDIDNLYPPIALVLFVPFIWLPYPLWWIVPGVVVAGAVWRLRPARWTWPLAAMRHSSAAWYYSLGNLPALLGPVWAWLGRREGGVGTFDDLRRVRPRSWPPSGHRSGVGA